MKKLSCLIPIFIIATSLISYPVLSADKWIRQSEIRPRISDAADQSETMFGDFKSTWYFHGARNENGTPDHGWVRSWLRNSGSRWGCRNWYDPEGDSIMPIRLGGAPYGTSDPSTVQFAVPDTSGITIHKYYRYHPPAIVVDGVHLEETFPQEGDHYAPDKVWGTADVMVESHARNWMGLDIYQRVMSWVSRHHNQYVVYDWTIVNTGNIDLDDEIEREGYAIDSLYFMRQLLMTPNNENQQKAEWHTWTGVYPDWDEPGDSVRCIISYPAIEWERLGGPPWDGDPLGCFIWERDYLDDPCSGGEVILYVPESSDIAMGPGPGAEDGDPENYPETDDSTQPRAHGIRGPDDLEYKRNSDRIPPTGDDSWETVYNAMKYGEKSDPQYEPYVEYMTATYPNTYHAVPTDLRGYERWNDLCHDNPQIFWHAVGNASMGPFHLDYGDSIRIVWADCGGRLSARASWELGKAWKDSSITFVTRSGDTLDINDISLTAPHLPNQADTIHIPPVYRNNPWRWQDEGYACDRANLIKDMWVYSTVDSVIRHSINAQWNFDHDYDIPAPPPPPSIEVTSEDAQIVIHWWYEEPSDEPSDLAGFKVYRSTGSAGKGPLIENDGVVGEWEVIYEAGPDEDTYNDTDVVGGEDYYYYVAAFDDGTHPETPYPGDVSGTPEVLESGRWQNNTTRAASLAGIEEREIPNVFSISKPTPNPFTKETVLKYKLPEDAEVDITLYNMIGENIRELFSGKKSAGVYQLTWDGTNKTGEKLPGGIYFLILRAGNKEASTKLMLVK